MHQSTYYVDKASGTPADTLLALGLAKLLYSLLDTPSYEGSKEVKIIDAGNHYRIELAEPLTEEMVSSQEFFPAIEFILTAKNSARQPAQTGVLSYETTKAKADNYRERINNLPPEARGPKANLSHPALQDLEPPRPDWPLFQAINQMAAIIGYNEVINRWEENSSQFPALVNLLLLMFGQSPNRIAEAEIKWNEGVKQGRFKGKLDATASQLFNPASGKGQNSTKSSSLAMGNLSNFWLLEFIKSVGAFECAAPRKISNKSNPRAKDRKLYVLSPRNMELRLNRQIWDEFQKSFKSATSVKMDIRAVLEYTRVFLDHSEEMARYNAEDEGEEPVNFVEGLWSVFYKDLGSGSAVMDISFIGLPDWIKDINSAEQIEQYQDIIQEHTSLYKNLDEKRSEEYDLLVTYRNFLSGRNWLDLAEFCAGYGRFYMSVLERDWERRGRYMRLPTTTNLEVIMTNHNPDLGEIIHDEGFLRLAYALRHSTVKPQRDKASGKDRLYEPKYGLIQELKRKGQYKDEFITALADFVSAYNLETEQVFESESKRAGKESNTASRKHLQRSRVEKKHLDAVIALIEKNGANGSFLVCNLLAAYGSATDAKSKDDRDVADPPEIDDEGSGGD